MSVKKDGAGVRKERINTFLDIITKSPDMTENKLKGVFYLRTGLSKATIEVYIEEMISLEILQREGDKLSALI